MRFERMAARRRQAAPVWHMDELIYRLCRLVDDGWTRVCIGSTARHAGVLSQAWEGPHG